MKKHGWLAILAGFMLIIGTICTAQAEEQLPAEIKNAFSGMEIVKATYWEEPGSTWFVLVNKPDGTNILFCYEKKDGSWIQSFHTAAAVPAGKDSVEWLRFTDKLVSFSDNCEYPGPILLIFENDGDYTTYQRSDSGEWKLFRTFWLKEQMYLIFNDDSVIFRIPIDQDHEKRVLVQGSFERDLRKVDINAIPRTPEQAQVLLNADQ